MLEIAKLILLKIAIFEKKLPNIIAAKYSHLQYFVHTFASHPLDGSFRKGCSAKHLISVELFL